MILGLSIYLNCYKCIMSQQKSEFDNKSKEQIKQNQNLVHRGRNWLFSRSFALISSLKISFPQAIVLFLIEQIQKFAIISRLQSNPTLSQSPEMVYVDAINKYLLLDISNVNDPSATVVSAFLLMCQLLLLFCFIFPFSVTANAIVSKYIVCVVEMTLIIPSIIQSANGMVNGVNLGLNGFLYLFTLANNLIYESMQFECSFQRQYDNVLVRGTRPLTVRLFILGMATLFPLITKLMFPISFLLYILVMLIVEIYKWIFYLKKFIYFHELFMSLKGIMLSLVISANLCYLAIYTMNNAIIAQNVLLFITTFCLFLSNFFIVFRNNIIKNTIINQTLRGEDEISLYCIFYWHCYKKAAEKKNQLYISSLLKKHMNECVNVTCCCKNRQILYDSNLKIFGNPKMQPHFDKVFIRHYIKKLLNDGYEEFNKSSTLTFLISYYNIEILEMITQTMELIRKLTRMQQKKQLLFSQQFLLYCLKKKTSDKILLINHKRGNVDLQSVKEFDEQLFILNDNLRQSIKMYFKLWKHLQSKLNETTLLDICKKSLELMFSIQQNYKELKSINTESTQLRTIMLFYSRLVLHDIHLLSEIKKDIKVSHQRNVMLSTLQMTSIQLFGTKTMTLIALQNNKIKWSSKNSNAIFEYSKQEFHGLTIKHLMPKYFAQNHDLYVQKWKETGHHVKLNRTSYVWGTTKNGTCFSMLLFAKVIPLLHEQDFAFSCCIEKVDDQNEIICNTYGQIYGSGKLFTNVIGINPKFLQQVKINIQIFMPFTFEYFLQYFYPENQKLKNLKRNYQIRREGYFPQNMEMVMMSLVKQRTTLQRKFKASDNYQRQYLSFIKQKMQELTCNVNGQYISFLMMPYKILSFQRDKKQIIILKISNLKRDNIQKFYLQLEKMINKLQSLTDQQKIGKSKTLTKKIKADDPRSFLDPKDIQQIAVQYQKQMESIKSIRELGGPGANSKMPFDNNTGIVRQKCARPNTTQSKAMMNITAHRKRLVKGSLYAIKSEKVRYNVWKIKKMLLKQGVISKYTFNLLIGPQLNLQSLNNKQSKDDKIADDVERRTLLDIYEEKNASDSEEDSMKHNSDGELAPNKENDNETFNSAASSATFISMTNHVKLFKQKLRSLNTPRSLWLLNLALMIMVIGGVSGLIYSVVTNLNNLSNGLMQFQNNQQANLIVDGLIMGQLNINNINHNSNNSYYQFQKTFLFESVTKQFRDQMYHRAAQQMIDPYILSYLNLLINGQNTIYVRDFIEQIIDQIVTNKFTIGQIYFAETINQIISHSSNNIFFNKIIACIFTVFLVFLLCAFFLFIVTIPIVYKIQIKIKEIYELLSKISNTEKQRYFRHFSQLDEASKKNEQMEFNQLSNMMQNFDNKHRNRTRVPLSEDEHPQSENNPRVKSEIVEDQKSKISSNKAIYVKLVVTYLVIISTIVAYYIFLNSAHSNFIEANRVFTQVFNQKTLLSFRISECYYEMMGYPSGAQTYSANVDLVSSIYDSYHLKGVSSTYINYVTGFTVAEACTMIPDYLNSSAMAFCEIINNKTFLGGGIDNLYYTQRKIQEKLQQYYQNRNNVSNPTNLSALNYPSYFSTEEFYELNIGYFFSTLMIQKLYDMISSQMMSFSSLYKTEIQIATYIAFVLLGIFTAMWIYIYLKLAENASYINAFLLLIPFDVLSQNPYIKLYIRNEFDYKSANY